MPDTAQKTIFIIVTRGFIVRNILRSGVLEHLKRAGFRIVVFFNTDNRLPIPDYLRKEFEDGQVILERASNISRRGYFFFSKITSLLVYSSSSWVYSHMNRKAVDEGFFFKHINKVFYGVLSKLGFLKTLVRFVEKKFFSFTGLAHYFEIYKPSIVFSTSILGQFDIAMMKEAGRRGIPTASMPKTWDNVTMVLYRFVPDLVLVQNTRMKEGIVRRQHVRPERISVCGFPQFDWYRRPEVLVSREEFCKWYGLDPGRKIIFFGSEGVWAPNDSGIVSLLAKWVNTPGALAKDSQLFVRPHYTDAKNDRFRSFRNISNVTVDSNINISDFFPGNWDPTNDETRIFTNLIYHCDILVTVASTLTLDGACFDKPLVNVAFGALFHEKTKRDITSIWYESDHYRWVTETDGVDIARSEKELLESINTYLRDLGRKREERRQLVDKLCYKVDGRSSERIAGALIELLNKKEASQSHETSKPI